MYKGSVRTVVNIQFKPGETWRCREAVGWQCMVAAVQRPHTQWHNGYGRWERLQRIPWLGWSFLLGIKIAIPSFDVVTTDKERSLKRIGRAGSSLVSSFMPWPMTTTGRMQRRPYVRKHYEEMICWFRPVRKLHNSEFENLPLGYQIWNLKDWAHIQYHNQKEV